MKQITKTIAIFISCLFVESNIYAQDKVIEESRVQTEHEISLENEIYYHNLINIAALIIVLVASIHSFSTIRLYRKSRKLNKELELKKDELEKQQSKMIMQNKLLEEKNRIITVQNNEVKDSINYAGYIQRAAMPSKTLIEIIFGDHMVIFHPRDIVSGDFYWAKQTDKYKMLAVADCTGHGVPGGFLSMLGMSILDYLAISADSNEDFSAATMLDEVRRLFKQSLHQRGKEEDNHDGMDMALVVMSNESNCMSYAGAFRPLLHVRDGVITKYDADRMPIGLHYHEAEHFTNHIIELNEGDCIYLYSDGMTDQFGYDDKNEVRKFTAKRLRTAIESVCSYPFYKQQQILEGVMESWRTSGDIADIGLYEQTDDMVLVGIKYDPDYYAVSLF